MIAAVRIPKKIGRPRMENPRNRTIGVTVDELTEQTLLDLAEDKGISISRLCREVIEDWLKRIKEEK